MCRRGKCVLFLMPSVNELCVSVLPMSMCASFVVIVLKTRLLRRNCWISVFLLCQPITNCPMDSFLRSLMLVCTLTLND